VDKKQRLRRIMNESEGEDGMKQYHGMSSNPAHLSVASTISWYLPHKPPTQRTNLALVGQVDDPKMINIT